MKKEDFVKLYGEAAYKRKKVRNKAWETANPEKREEIRRRRGRKGGKWYKNHLRYEHTGLQGERNVVRATHARTYRKYKNIIAPDSVLHHQWCQGTSGYDGIALVESNQHQHGIIDVIQILEGTITLLTEEAIREQTKQPS